jgi:hypothetical protein
MRTQENQPVAQQIAQLMIDAVGQGTLQLTAAELKSVKDVADGSRPAEITFAPTATGGPAAVKSKITLSA